jgi:pimeloyl-ACP methyl ester carboxylesterase
MSTLMVNGARIELIDRGRGPPILFLHPHIGLDPSAPVLSILAEGGRLIAPSHPGFGHSERPAGITTVDDLAYFYLDLMDVLDLRDTLVVGVSLGAWIAAAVAVKSTARITGLVLGNPVGIKVGDRETRDIRHLRHAWKANFSKRPLLIPRWGGGITAP